MSDESMFSGNIELSVSSNWPSNEQNFSDQSDEIEALKSYFDNTQNFDVLEEASIENSKLNLLQFTIYVNCPQKELILEIWLPNNHSEFVRQKEQLEQDDQASASASGSASATSSFASNNYNQDLIDAPARIINQTKHRPQLERSISGKRSFTQIKCQRLPTISLTVLLSSSYPSKEEPLFEIDSNYLNRCQLTQLCTKLDEIWADNSNMPILFTWIDWLQTNLIDYLDLCEADNKLILTPLNDEHHNDINDHDDDDVDDISSCKHDKRAISSFTTVDDLIFQILRYNYVEEIKEFRNSMQNCLICFEEKLGKDFFRLNECKHHFCADCMIEMCQMHVKEGTIQLLKCPDKECKEFVPIDIMRDVLSQEEFERWERLLLQRTLDSMEDVIYCPKCSTPIVVDTTDTHSFCMNCKIDYCKLCKETWHLGLCSNKQDTVDQKLKNLNITLEKFLTLTNEEIKQRFKNSSYVIDLIKKMELKKENQKAEDFLRKYVKCPKCKAPIEKIEGCNKVVCNCGCMLCYICGKVIYGYDHFQQGSCNLWNTNNNVARRVPEPELHQAQQAMQRILANAPEQIKNVINCINCGQRCLKMERNNHIKCWLCATNFCFCCKKKIVGNITNHFRQSTCKQHSD